MRVITARNVHQALPIALDQLARNGVERDSRNGPVVMFGVPVTTVYLNPAERVIFWAKRDANPFFHLMESLWMLGGRNDVGYVAQYVSRMREFSDDGKTFHGAYGFRWREHFGFDQLAVVIAKLRADPNSRREVLSMWDAAADLGRDGKDLPCNLQVIFQINAVGSLDMMVTNRSNDMVWGAYGANAVHMSYLHEYVARSIGVPQGVYRQVSANFHTYKAVWDQICGIATELDQLDETDPYMTDEVAPFPLMSLPQEEWDKELEMFLSDPFAIGFRDPFFRRVAIPMVRAHRAYQMKEDPDRYANAMAELINVDASDWRKASMEWIERREAAFLERQKARAQDDGVLY